MNLVDILDKELIKVPLVSTDKASVIDELVDVLIDTKHLTPQQRDGIIEAVKNREALGSTGIGHGVAIPHAKTDAVKQMRLVVGVSRLPIDFDAVDKEPVRIFFLVLAPVGESGPHVETLAAIARTCSSQVFRRLLEQSKNAGQVYQLFME
jgi:mannitol/fructose-specific phosphotransferase system IIA component (Ntr-type)